MGSWRDGFEIIVDDDGPGIPADAFERIFERFYTDRPNQGFGQNSGLGLSISRQIIEAHGGRIRARTASPRRRDGSADRSWARALLSGSGRRGERRRRRSCHVSVHASGVVVWRGGIVIRGASGAGKSSLALALLDAAAQAALFGALIGDDRLLLSRAIGRLIARGHPAIRGQIEQRGVGILEIGAEPAASSRLDRRYFASRNRCFAIPRRSTLLLRFAA